MNKPMEFTPISVVRHQLSVRIRKDGKVTPAVFPCVSPNDQKELAREKAAALNLPIMFLGPNQSFSAQVDDGVYAITEVVESIARPA